MPSDSPYIQAMVTLEEIRILVNLTIMRLFSLIELHSVKLAQIIHFIESGYNLVSAVLLH